MGSRRSVSTSLHLGLVAALTIPFLWIVSWAASSRSFVPLPADAAEVRSLALGSVLMLVFVAGSVYVLGYSALRLLWVLALLLWVVICLLTLVFPDVPWGLGDEFASRRIFLLGLHAPGQFVAWSSLAGPVLAATWAARSRGEPLAEFFVLTLLWGIVFVIASAGKDIAWDEYPHLLPVEAYSAAGLLMAVPLPLLVCSRIQSRLPRLRA